MVNLKVGAAFAPLCHDEKAYHDTTAQKPLWYVKARFCKGAAKKHCSYLVYYDILPTKALIIKGCTPAPQRFLALRHKLPTLTARAKVLRFWQRFWLLLVRLAG